MIIKNYYVINITHINLFSQQWDACKSILDTLKVFNDATYTLSGVCYPTIHLYLIEGINICDALGEHENDLNLFSCIQAMKNKWLEYFKIIPFIYLVVCVFYSRCKLDGLHDYLKAYYDIIQVDEDVYDLFSKIKKVIYALYNEYIVKVLIIPVMARLVVKMRTPLNLVEDNYYLKGSKNPGDLHQARTPSLIVI